MGQIFIIPVCLILGSFIGVVVTSCAGESRLSSLPFATQRASLLISSFFSTAISTAGFYPDEGLLW